MASYRTSVATWNTTTGTHTATLTTALRDLIIILAGNGALASDPAVSDDSGDGQPGYTKIGSTITKSTNDKFVAFARNKLMGTAASTIFSATGPSSTGGGLIVIAVSGMFRWGNGNNGAVRRISGTEQFGNQNSQLAGTPAPTLPAAALTGNMLIALVNDTTNGSANCAPRSSPAWTEIHDQGYTATANGIEAQYINSGETASVITLGAATPSGFSAMVFELDASRNDEGWGVPIN